MNQQSSTNKLPLYLSTALIVVVLAFYFLHPAFQSAVNESWDVISSNDESRIKAYVSELGWIGPVFIVLLMILQMFLIFIPSILVMIATILAYGPIWGSIIVIIAIFITSSIGYLVGRYFGLYITNKIIGEKTERKIEDIIHDYGFGAVIVSRINPFLSLDAISFVGGMLRMGYWKFIGATLLGISPLVAYIAIIGESTERLKTGLLWGSVVCLFIFAAYIYWDKKIRKKSKSTK